MTPEDILRMAREAGWNWPEVHTTSIEDRLERFFKLAYEAGAKDEREACARVCEDDVRTWSHPGSITREECAAAIRARGQPDPKVTHLNAWARDRLARHGIQIPEDEEYGNPSF
jgi:hypothetical protein